MPLISVLIPAYNAESTIEAAIASILRQTCRDFEVVVVDDGSIDSTPDLLDSFSAADSRVRVIHSPKRGIISALNTGLEVSSGELIARMDADDISHPSRLEMQARLMEAQLHLSVCSCLVRQFPRDGLLGGLLHYEDWLNSLTSHQDISRDIFIESPVAHPSVMLRRRELVEIGGYQERGWAEDYDLWLRYREAGKHFAKVEKTLVFWRQSEGRLTFTDRRYSVENFLRAKAHYLARILKGSNRPIVLWGAGKTGRRIIKHLLREGMDIEAVIDIDAKKIGHTLRGRPIVGPDYLIGRPEAFVIAAVSSRGARGLIREHLRQMGFAEVRDFVCAA
ncbi:MAG: glycosyltransferase [Armatimonadetes bacterium]|nr:glycosyltransferase [Armatimonadota bacterium]